MKVEMMQIDKLIPYARNPRRNDAAVDAVAASIKEFGFRQPIVVDEDMVILVGHTRFKAARKLGLQEVPVHVATGLTDAQKKAYRIADNRLNEIAEWDNDLLELELEDLRMVDFDLALTGFDADELLEIMAGEETTIEGNTDEDAAPEVPETPVSKPGDVWLLGGHRVMCGDSTSTESVDLLMQGSKADMVFTDPPYALFGNSTGISGVADDKMIRPFFRKILTECKTRVKRYGHVYVCCDWHSVFVIESISREVDLTAKNLIVWDKGSGGVGNMYQQCYELVFFFGNTPKQTTTTKTGSSERIVQGVPNIWRFPRVNPSERQHNAAKPVDMICVPIEASSDRGEIVLDLFGGSGSTLIACEKSDRLARLMEIEPRYCDVIVKRWQDWTGQQATREADGVAFDDLVGTADAIGRRIL
jgi:DNA modification methylase